MTRLILVLMTLLLVAGCQHAVKKAPPPQIEVQTQIMPYECGKAPAADPYVALKVKWAVYTIEGRQVFALATKDYQNLMTNTVKLLTSGKQVRDQRDFYADCIKRSAPAPSATIKKEVTLEPASPAPRR